MSVRRTISSLNKKICGRIEEWRNRPIKGKRPYVFSDGLWLKVSWGGEVSIVSVLVALTVDEHGYRDIMRVFPGYGEDDASWTEFLRHLVQRGLKGVRMVNPRDS